MIGLGVRTNKINVGGGVAPPANTIAPAVSGTAVVGQTLTTTNGTWSNSPTSYTYQWYRGASAISGATSSTYVLVQADAGNTSNIKCVVTATNAGGSASADSNTVAQVLTVRTNSFLTAAGITDTTIKGASNALDIGISNELLDSDIFALHLCVGGTAASMKFNFMNAADSDSANRLIYSGSWVYNSNGLTGNGTNTTINAFVNPLTKYTTTNGFFGVIIGNNVNTNAYDVGFGTAGFGLALYTTQAYFMFGGGFTSVSRTNNAGFYAVNKVGGNVEGYYNGTRIMNTAISTTLYNGNGAIGSSGVGSSFSNNNYRCIVHALNMNQTKIAILHSLLSIFNTTIGR